MITHVHSGTVNVRDLDEALAFYVDASNVSFAMGCGISLITDDIDGDVAGLVEQGCG